MTGLQKKTKEIEANNNNLKLHEESVSIANAQFKQKYNKMSDVKIADDRRCILQRVLGHKDDMPGSGQWRMITTLND